MTAVHYAVLKDFVDIVTYLVEEQGADLEISTKVCQAMHLHTLGRGRGVEAHSQWLA